MKIVVTTDCFLPRWDGISKFLSLLLPRLAKDHEVVVFAPAFPGPVPIVEGVTVRRFPLMPWQFGDIQFCWPDKKMMREEIKDADVVFNQTIGPIGMAGIQLGKRYNKRVVSYAHSIEWELARRAVKHGKTIAWYAVRLLARRLLNKCSLILVPSKEVDDILSENKVRVQKELVPLGVPVKQFAPPKDKRRAKGKVGIPLDKTVIGFCGRIAREKDLPTLYTAFKKVRKRYPQTVLLIVGEGLEDVVPPSKSVLRVGRQDDVVPYLRAMDMFVMPSLTETSSLATMEAMATGLPVMATPVGSIREYVYHKETGLLFARGDVAELVNSIVFLIENEDKREEIGRAARRMMVKKYSWSKTAQKIKNVLMP